MQPSFSPADHRRGLAAVAVAAVVWSTGGLFIKLLPFSALTILFYRSVFAALLFAAVYRKQVLLFNRQSLLTVVFYALLLVSFVSATKMTTAANAIFLQYTAPIYILIAEPLLFKMKLQRINVFTIVACIIGMLLFFGDGLDTGGGMGNVVALFSGLMLAGLLLSQRLNHPDYHIGAIFWGNILVAVIGLPAFMQSASPTGNEFLMLCFLGFIQIGVGYLLFTYGLKRTLAIESALLAMIEPILNPLWVWIGYGERPSNYALIGGAIIIVALAVRTLLTERRKAAI